MRIEELVHVCYLRGLVGWIEFGGDLWWLFSKEYVRTAYELDYYVCNDLHVAGACVNL